jgi:hypothetical protein
MATELSGQGLETQYPGMGTQIEDNAEIKTGRDEDRDEDVPMKNAAQPGDGLMPIIHS